MSLRYPPFFSVQDFDEFDKWHQLDDAAKMRIKVRDQEKD